MSYTFTSAYKVGRFFVERELTDFVVKNEPMLFNCSWDAAWLGGGLITYAFLRAIEKDAPAPRDEMVVDTRVHMLMPGWYPCIPGYHHDDVERSRADGQPNYDTPSYRSQHVLGLVGGDVCPTEFALGTADFEPVPHGETVYKQWHDEVVRHLEAGRLTRASAPSGRLVYFDDRTWHQGVQAVGSGWRWFGRVSWGTKRQPTNERRSQVQVYLENPTEGW